MRKPRRLPSGKDRVQLSAYLPAGVAERLRARAEAIREPVAYVIRRAIEQWLGERPSPAPSEVLAAPERSASLVRHPRIASLVDQIREAGADAAKLSAVRETALAILYDLVNRIHDQADVLDQLADGEVEVPRMLTDPAALVPVIECLRKLELTLHQIDSEGRLTIAEFRRLSTQWGGAVRGAVFEAVRVLGGLPEDQAEALAARVCERLAQGAEAGR